MKDSLDLDPQLRMVVVSSGQRLLGGPAEAFVERVKFAPDGPALRLFPAGTKSRVVIDPLLAGGAEAVRGIGTEALRELIDGGEPLSAVAEDFALEAEELEHALAYKLVGYSLTGQVRFYVDAPVAASRRLHDSQASPSLSRSRP